MIHLNVLTRFNQKIKVKIFDQFYDQNKVSPKYAIEHRYKVAAMPQPKIANCKDFS